jgi:hypothetical protein
MSTKVRSAKGAVVDFDLMRIKSQIAASPKTNAVKKRETFIDKKRRKNSNVMSQLVDEQSKLVNQIEASPTVEPTKVNNSVEPPQKTQAEIIKPIKK